MPYKDPMKAKSSALDRSRRYRARKHDEKYGPDAPDQRGKHSNHSKGKNHYRWNDNRILSDHGYIKIRVGTNHPLADSNGYAYEHTLVVLSSNTPGAYLLREQPDQWVIHHQNEDKTDNRLENLIVVERDKHTRLHNMARTRDELGRFVGKHAAGRLLDGREHNDFPAL